MKNLSLILNIVLLVAVGVLFYLHFSSKSQKSSGSVAAPVGDLTIAYVNSDSVLKNYLYTKESQTVLEAKAKKLDTDLNNRANALRNDFAAYQRNEANMTIGQAKALQEDLAKKEQNLQMYQQSLNQQMGQEQAKFIQDLYDRLTAYVKTYSEQNGLQVVFKRDASAGSDLLFGIDALDISKPITDGMNEAYAAEKNGVKAKADSLTKK